MVTKEKAIIRKVISHLLIGLQRRAYYGFNEEHYLKRDEVLKYLANLRYSLKGFDDEELKEMKLRIREDRKKLKKLIKDAQEELEQ